LAWQSVEMLVTPRPGVSMDNLIQDLQTSRDEAFNLRGGSGHGVAAVGRSRCSVPVASAIT